MFMCVDLRFATSVDPRVHTVFVGTSEFEFNSGVIAFDFECSIGAVDSLDPRVVHCRLSTLDTEVFPESAVLLKRSTWDGLRSIRSVSVDVGESLLQLVSVSRISVDCEDWDSIYDVSHRVLADFEDMSLKGVA